MKEYTLSNGLKVVLCPMPNVHSVSVSLYVRSGSRNELPDEYGITHMLEHMHFRELKNMNQSEIYYAMESIGGSLRGTTYADFLRFHMKVHSMYFEKCIQIFWSILDTDCWTMESIENERTVVLNEMYEKGSYMSMDDYIREKVFGVKNRIIGYEDNVQLLDQEKLSSYKQKIFNCNNMLLCVFGNIKDNTLELIEKHFTSIKIPCGEKGRCVVRCDNRFSRSPDITLIKEDYDIMDVTLSFDVDYTKATIGELRLLNSVLGEGVGSRLQLKIREELGYNYDTGSDLESYCDCGALHIRFLVNKKQLTECLNAVIGVLKDIKTEIRQRDIDITLPFFKENEQFYLDDPEEYSWYYAYNNFVLEKDDSLAHLDSNEKIMERLRIVANDIFDFKNASLIIIGDSRKVLKKKLSDIIKSVN